MLGSIVGSRVKPAARVVNTRMLTNMIAVPSLLSCAPWVPELDSIDRFRNVAQMLSDRGWEHVDVEKVLGGNWLRYFERVFGT